MATSGFSIGIPVDKLKGIEDYNQWKFMIKMVLMHEDLYECIESAESADACKDDKKKQKALAKICLSVGPSALGHVRNAKTPYEAWTNLQRAYEDKGLCRRLGLLRSLFGVKLSEAESMQSYLSRITELGQQLDDINSKLEDEFLAVIMLSGLTTDYDPLIMALENSNTALTTETVRTKLLQEQQRRDEKSEHSDMNALAVKKVIKCFRCKKTGHMKKDCPKNQKSDTSDTKNSQSKDKSLLTALSVNVRNDVWYIDSGATNHMCNNEQIMFDFQSSKALEVNVANGDKVMTSGHGKVRVNLKSGHKTISNVYLIPKLSANLLSVSELNRKGYNVIFKPEGCKIYDGSEIIATGTCNNGIYQLDTVEQALSCEVMSEIAMDSACESPVACESLQEGKETALAAESKVSQDVWHRRLGHLNSRSMNLMKSGLATGILPDRANKVEDIYLRFYNGSNVEEYVDFPLCQASRLFEIKGFDKNSPTVLYMHGFIETAQQESVQVMVNAYLEARPGTNVVLLDWSNMSHGSYLVNAARNSKKVGQATAEHVNKLLEAGLPADKLHFIGHSLGSHVAGYAARELKNKYNKSVKRLTALDPAFPAFYPDGVVMEHVSAKDADFVDVIHTDAGGYGAPVRTGTVDFWPNGGKSVQPGCPRFAPMPLTDDNLCSHWRSWRFYAESVRNPQAFPASPADSYQKFRENPSPEDGMIYMGYSCDTSAQGSYYLTTNAQPPFGQGMDGLCPKKKKNKAAKKL